MKKLRTKTKKQCANEILDLLFMKEPPEADVLLGLMCETKDVINNRAFVLFKLLKQSLPILKQYVSLAVVVADATHCDELPK
jgi:hypothetical protein